MPLAITPVQERRKFNRTESAGQFAINLLQPHGAVEAEHVNVSEGGLCLRVQEPVEVRSLVRLQVTPESATPLRARRPMTCTGRVAWVNQRLDLRTIPPFLYDVGIEFVDPPPLLRQLMAARGVELPPLKRRALQEKSPASATIRGRRYAPRVERTSTRPPRWHLVISVDGVPCVSEHYPSERAATTAWSRFKRRQARRRT